MPENRSFAMTRALSMPEKRTHFAICVIAIELIKIFCYDDDGVQTGKMDTFHDFRHSR